MSIDIKSFTHFRRGNIQVPGPYHRLLLVQVPDICLEVNVPFLFRVKRLGATNHSKKEGRVQVQLGLPSDLLQR